MRNISSCEIAAISGGALVYVNSKAVHGNNNINIEVYEEDVFYFKDLTFVYNGCFFQEQPIHPLKLYSGYRVVTTSPGKYCLIST